MFLPAGTRLGRYEVRSQIGAGGMGEVYLARDTTELEREAAIKVLPADLAADPERMRRFVQEAKTASSLNHPNIITIYEIGEADSWRFIATEYVEGETLRQRMARSRLSLREALDIAVQVASALMAAHRAGVVHRDIKPENVMLREDGIVKVLDFGIAKPTGRLTGQPSADSEAATRALVNTAPGTIMGTISYMSPEQARGLEVDERTDLWSLGVVIYETVSGRVPFLGETATDVLATILHREPPSLLQGRDVPDELERIVEKALTKDREERYQTAKDLALDLKRLRQRLDTKAELERSVTPDREGESRGTVTGGSHVTPQYGGVATQMPRSAPSIAVLPFANLSADPENEYFCEGLAEELLNALAKVDGLKVAARTSAFSFKGKSVKVSEIGQALNVNAVLEGGVRKAGDRLRITVQLISVADGYHLWSERYDREMRDIFDVQDDITLAVIDALRVNLLGQDKALVLKRHTDNNEAYELYLKGRFFWFKFNPEALRKARENFEQALRKDPDFVLAGTGLADALSASAVFTTPKDVFPKAKGLVSRALELDPSLAEAWASKAAVEFFYEWDWTGAERDCQQAIGLNPGYMLARDLYSLCLLAQGRFEEAVVEARRASGLDPLSGYINATLGLALYYSRRYDEAGEQLLKGAELDTDNVWAHAPLIDLYEQVGANPEALGHRQKLATLAGDGELAVELGHEFERSGYRGVLLKWLDGLHRRADLRYVSPLDFAGTYARLGERDKALDWLEKAVEERTMYVCFMKVRPTWDGLRDDPRFQDLMRRVGLPQ